MAGIENGVEYGHIAILFRSGELIAEDEEWLRWILQGTQLYTKDSTSHTEMSEAITKGLEVTARQIRKWRQCEACMRERNVDIHEPPLHVARYCQFSEPFRQELYRASTE